MERKRIAEATKGMGKPKVGGPFELVDQEGKKFTDEDLKGGYSLVCAPISSSKKKTEKRSRHLPQTRIESIKKENTC